VAMRRRKRARAWLRRNFGSICAVGCGEASGRRAEAKLGHEAGRISESRREMEAMPGHANRQARVKLLAASRVALARLPPRRCGTGRPLDGRDAPPWSKSTCTSSPS